MDDRRDPEGVGGSPAGAATAGAGDAPGAAAPALVRLASPLVALFPDAPRVVSIEAADVAALIDALDARWPGMGGRIRDERPAIRRHMNIFVDGERARLDTRIRPGADVFVLTAISGG